MESPLRPGSAVHRDTWRELLGAAYAAPDGREFLIAVLGRLKDQERPRHAPPALTEGQLRWVLDQMSEESQA